ncbi:hypothetical protein RugamoR57_51430 [Duganella caerulea]|uniref:hypothetical protein n=1 Tax=Duganella caerulea TaxID=2885762 RepID=UPI0030EAB7F2
MLFDKQFKTVEELWDYEENERIRESSEKVAKQIGLQDSEQKILSEALRTARYSGMQDALYTGRMKGYYEGCLEGRQALVEVLCGLLEKSAVKPSRETYKMIALAELSELSDWVRQLMAGAEPNEIFD